MRGTYFQKNGIISLPINCVVEASISYKQGIEIEFLKGEVGHFEEHFWALFFWININTIGEQQGKLTIREWNGVEF